MPFLLATCGFKPAALSAHPDHDRAVVLPTPADADFLDRAMAALREQAQQVVLLYAATTANRRRVAMLRAMLRDTPTHPMGVVAPTTALAGVAAVLTSLAARDVAPALAAGHLMTGPGRLATYAATTSVTGVNLPGVRFSHHLASYLPGTVFTIALDSEPSVGTQVLTRPQPSVAVDLVTLGDDNLLDRLKGVTPRSVGERLGYGTALTEPVWWGRARFYEQTLVPRDVEQVAETINAQLPHVCQHCGEAVLDLCPFCIVQGGERG